MSESPFLLSLWFAMLCGGIVAIVVLSSQPDGNPNQQPTWTGSVASALLAPLAISYVSLLLYYVHRRRRARHIALMLRDRDAALQNLPYVFWPRGATTLLSLGHIPYVLVVASIATEGVAAGSLALLVFVTVIYSSLILLALAAVIYAISSIIAALHGAIYLSSTSLMQWGLGGKTIIPYAAVTSLTVHPDNADPAYAFAVLRVRGQDNHIDVSVSDRDLCAAAIGAAIIASAPTVSVDAACAALITLARTRVPMPLHGLEDVAAIMRPDVQRAEQARGADRWVPLVRRWYGDASPGINIVYGVLLVILLGLGLRGTLPRLFDPGTAPATIAAYHAVCHGTPGTAVYTDACPVNNGTVTVIPSASTQFRGGGFGLLQASDGRQYPVVFDDSSAWQALPVGQDVAFQIWRGRVTMVEANGHDLVTHDYPSLDSGVARHWSPLAQLSAIAALVGAAGLVVPLLVTGATNTKVKVRATAVLLVLVHVPSVIAVLML